MTIVPVSEWIKGEMQLSFLKDANFQVIHNGINLDNFRICNADEIRAKYALGNRHVILGVASIWMAEKGWDDFMQMAPLLRDDEVIVLVGVTEEQKKKLPANVIGISRTENVHQLAELYSAAVAFVNPTWQDNYPTVNLEAIACGTPVVTYRTGGSIEAVTDKTGIVVEQGDVQGLLDAVRLIEGRGIAFNREACRQYALQKFDKNDRYADYIRLYERLLGEEE